MVAATRKNRRAKERRDTLLILTGLGVALVVSIALWPLYFKVRMVAPEAPRFSLTSSTGQTVSLGDFLGRQDVVLVFYMVAT
jgi:hypothetical protein